MLLRFAIYSLFVFLVVFLVGFSLGMVYSDLQWFDIIAEVSQS